jgi:hypothetical protein
MNNTWIGYALAAAAFYVGYRNYGWQGVIFATTVVVFWLLLQYSRVNRVMTKAAASEMGTVSDARSLGLKLKKGQPLVDVLKMTGSLGLRTSNEPETFRWTDPTGASIEVVFEKGRASRWSLGAP